LDQVIAFTHYPFYLGEADQFMGCQSGFAEDVTDIDAPHQQGIDGQRPMASIFQTAIWFPSRNSG
jgi:hypothetical protein